MNKPKQQRYKHCYICYMLYHTTSVTLKHYFQQKMHKTQRNIFFVVDHVNHREILTSCVFYLTHPQYLFEFGSKYV